MRFDGMLLQEVLRVGTIGTEVEGLEIGRPKLDSIKNKSRGRIQRDRANRFLEAKISILDE